jgi:plastocyanin
MKSIKFFSYLAIIMLLAVGCAPVIKTTAPTSDMSSMPIVNSTGQPNDTGTVFSDQMAIEIKGFAFTPQIATVKVGTQVTWTNKDSAPHTVTADDRSFDSGTLDQGESFTFQFTTPGTFAYICTIHPSMQATIIVVQ